MIATIKSDGTRKRLVFVFMRLSRPPDRQSSWCSGLDFTSPRLGFIASHRHLLIATPAKELYKLKSLADPTKLKPLLKEGLVQVIIETPAGSRNKFAYDPDQGIFALKKVLPAGMVFPYDFGFLPQTIAPDGDPIDVLLLMDEPAFPGCAVKSRLIGVIEGEQLDGKKKVRNDRLVAVAEVNHMYANIRRLKDLPSKWLDEVQDFFVNYHGLEGKKYQLLGCKGQEVAFRLIKKAHKAA
jgi:inorganic pyrophosphatase